MNFSEGRNPAVIRRIRQAVFAASDPNAPLTENGVRLLHCDSNTDANRTVLTLVGAPNALTEAAFAAAKEATECIDMRLHRGAHPRIGATDVIPIVPLGTATLGEAAQWADRLARRLADQLHLPVYLYAENAANEERRRLPFIRKGEYEGLADRMRSGFYPDYGPHTLPPKSGATAVGARNLMIALNINLKSCHTEIAQKIAERLRTSGYFETINGEKVHRPGRFQGLQAKGWFMEHYHCAQITANIHDLHATPPHLLYLAAAEEAEKWGETVNGCELIGLIPRRCLLEAGCYAMKAAGTGNQAPSAPGDGPVGGTRSPARTAENRPAADKPGSGDDPAIVLQAGIDFLGLQSVRDFHPERQIMEAVLGR